MDKWICKKCGEKFEVKPIEHGGVYPTLFGKKLGEDYKCNGEIEALSPENDEAKPRDLSVGHQSNCIVEDKNG